MKKLIIAALMAVSFNASAYYNSNVDLGSSIDFCNSMGETSVLLYKLSMKGVNPTDWLYTDGYSSVSKLSPGIRRMLITTATQIWDGRADLNESTAYNLGKTNCLVVVLP
jgi:hypothetical protein